MTTADHGAGDAIVRLSSPHFCAGVIVIDGRVSSAAPILRYMRGWSMDRVRSYARRRGWRVDEMFEAKG